MLTLRRPLALLSASLLLACTPGGNQEPNNPVDPSTRPIYSAVLSSVSDPSLQRTWKTGDLVAVFNTPSKEEYAFEGADGSLKGTLKSTGSFAPNQDPLSKVYAVIPYNFASSLDPTEGVRVSFPSSSAIGNEVNSSVWVAANDASAGTLNFQSATAYLNLPLYGNGNVKSIELLSIEKICGSGTVVMTDQGPKVDMGKASDDRTYTLTLTPPGGSSITLGNTPETATSIRIPLPATVFEMGFSITVEGNSGKAFCAVTPPGELKANTELRVEPVSLDFVKEPKDNDIVPFKDQALKDYLLEFRLHRPLGSDITMEQARTIMDFNIAEGEAVKYQNKIKSFDDFQYLPNLFNIVLEEENLTSLEFRNNAGLGQIIARRSPKLEHIDFHGAPNIGILLISECNFSTLDLSPLPFLYNLYCSNNSLKELDLSKTGRLMNLGCENNQLTSLDLSHNPLLEELYCSGNQLTSLDLSHTPKLTKLFIDSNRIEEIDLSHSLNLKELLFGGNNFTSIDVSKNTQINLLSCENNALTELDLSSLKDLVDLNCNFNQLTTLDISNNPKLSELRCGFNQLSSLDLKGLSKLVNISCPHNLITALDVSNCPDLTILECNDNLIQSLDVSNNPKLEYLNCWSDNLKELWLKSGQTIEDLYYNPNVTEIKYK